jgi:AcrR family transcriptional regulator
MVQKEEKPRGRPRLYVESEALDRAMGVFWDRGFAAASLDDLSSAMGMNRPSIYAAFGDKTDLFIKTLDRYEASGRQTFETILGSDQALPEALRAFFLTLVDVYTAGEEAQRGCLMSVVAVSEAVNTPAIRTVTAQAVVNLDAAFEARFVRAIKQGELAPTAVPSQLAVLASGLVHSLAVRARSGEPRSSLERVIEVFVTALVGKSQG